MARDMRRYIEAADSQVNHVGEAFEVAITGSAIFDDFDNTVNALTDGIGQISVDKGNDIVVVIS